MAARQAGRGRLRRLTVIVLLGVIGASAGLFGAMAANRDTLSGHNGITSRDLGCGAVSDVRGRAICRRLQREMEWTWTGHAIISPGWRVTFQSIVRTYCKETVGSKDVKSLEALRQSSRDWRTESGAEFLLRLVRNKDGTAHEDVNSIFNVHNPSYILKGGCPLGR
jgi:hypothetical protein